MSGDEPGHDFQERRLAAARAADHRGGGAGLDPRADAFQHLRATALVAVADPFEDDLDRQRGTCFTFISCFIS
jgi:hypothetical protein